MSAPIAYDTLRLFLGRWVATPRGIDRVDLSYARYFFQTWPGDCVGTLPTPWGIRWYARERMLAALDRLEEFWSETVIGAEDPGVRRVKALLAGESAPAAERRGIVGWNGFEPLPRVLQLLSGAGHWFGASTGTTAPQNAIYVNVGQIGLAVPWFVRWLRYRTDVKSVFMLHDVIPLENPEFCSARGQRIHRKIVDIAARHASGLILTTAAARDSVLREIRLRGRSEIPVETLPLPVAPIFLEKEEPDPELLASEYFIVCGAIEPRKNHSLLFHVWLNLIRQRGARAPKLVVVGPLGWGAPSILHMLQQSKLLQEHVIIAHHLSSRGLRRLIAHARALLMPSFAEGFGLPVIEALAVGTPVVASDLPAHREIAGDLALYCNPIDGPGWLQAIALIMDGGEATTELRRRITHYQPFTWSEYFVRLERFLSSFT
jgi:glycosyltransferase involved in cell wall biosynthesis